MRLNTRNCPLRVPFLLFGVPSPLRRLRQIAMHRARQEFDAETPRSILIGRTLLWPLLALLHSARMVRRHRHFVRKETGWGPLRQFLHLTNCMLSLNLRPQDYYDALAFLPDRRHRAKTIIPEHEAQALLVGLIAGRDLSAMDNKVLFQQAASAAGLPLPELVAAFVSGNQTHGAVELPPADLFAKRACGWGGKGAELWRWREGTWHRGGETLAAPALLARFAARSRTEPWLVQRRLRNHAVWAGLTPGALATVRIVTLHHGDGIVAPLVALLRFPRAHAVVDNVCSGGFAAVIDLASGRLGPARQAGMHTPTVTVHPDTGYTFAGTVLPEWTALRDLAVRAHQAFLSAATVGWDLTLAEEGPHLIEANLRWGLPHDSFIGETPFVDFCLSRLAVPAATRQPVPA